MSVLEGAFDVHPHLDFRTGTVTFFWPKVLTDIFKEI